MEDFPPELIDRISSFLDLDGLKQTLIVSRQFQVAAERRSGGFRNFTIKDRHLKKPRTRKLFSTSLTNSEDDDYAKFLKIYNGARFRYLRYIEVHTSFPPLRCSETDPYKLPCRENRDDIARKDRLFTEQIKRLFQTIKAVEDNVRSNNDSSNIELVIVSPVQLVDDVFCRHRVSSAWRVHLLQPQDLPELHSVRSFSMCNPMENYPSNYNPFRQGDFYAHSRLDWRMLIDIAGKLPNLEYLGCQLGVEEGRQNDVHPAKQHFEFDYEACARDSRHGFAEALESVSLPASLRYVQLDFLHTLDEHMSTHSGKAPNFLPRSGGYDIFSNNLRIFSSNLKRLDLRVMADETLFWPTEGSASWPNLELLDVTFHIARPCGSWYFRGPIEVKHFSRGYDITEDMYPPLEPDSERDSPWHTEESLQQSNQPYFKFRRLPLDKHFRPFLAAFAKSLAHMPGLKVAALWTSHELLTWGIAYASACRVTSYSSHKNEDGVSTLYTPQEEVPTRKLWWTVSSWRPDAELHRLFQEIGSERGEGLVEYWNICGKDLSRYQDSFDVSLAAFPRPEDVYPRLSLAEESGMWGNNIGTGQVLTF